MKTIHLYLEYFPRSKKDGSRQMILNLKRLNKSVGYKYFKMESLQNVLELIRPVVFMASEKCLVFNTCSQKPLNLLDIFGT